jgi:hypothetical protein
MLPNPIALALLCEDPVEAARSASVSAMSTPRVFG